MTFCALFTSGASPPLTEGQVAAIHRHLVACAS
jgi:hypothetical protein